MNMWKQNKSKLNNHLCAWKSVLCHAVDSPFYTKNIQHDGTIWYDNCLSFLATQWTGAVVLYFIPLQVSFLFHFMTFHSAYFNHPLTLDAVTHPTHPPHPPHRHPALALGGAARPSRRPANGQKILPLNHSPPLSSSKCSSKCSSTCSSMLFQLDL